MRDVVYRVMCLAHRVAKCLIKRRERLSGIRFVDITPGDVREDGTVLLQCFLNGASEEHVDCAVDLDQLYPLENAVPLRSNPKLRTSFRTNEDRTVGQTVKQFSPDVWRKFINAAEIPAGYRNGGLKYAGFIASSRDSWCLPSWIWTNAASVRYLCTIDDVAAAECIGVQLLAKQEADGGWVVRSDFTDYAEIPVLAPNDSAYIANNALLSLYGKTADTKYLWGAIKCADWIADSARPDGLVWTGRNQRTGEWLKNYTIVDTGFTAGLFANLYLLTGEDRYRSFLERFVERFIELFFDPGTQSFATSIDDRNKRFGGRFARGQAWALEGLIPAYKVLRTDSLKDVIQANVNLLLKEQLANGGWVYNFDRAYFGEDCKGVPVIAKSLLEWNKIHQDKRLRISAERALAWCKKHTSLSGPSLGGIFSFNLEGAVVHNLYTKTAFVYSSAYALETLDLLLSDD